MDKMEVGTAVSECRFGSGFCHQDHVDVVTLPAECVGLGLEAQTPRDPRRLVAGERGGQEKIEVSGVRTVTTRALTLLERRVQEESPVDPFFKLPVTGITETVPAVQDQLKFISLPMGVRSLAATVAGLAGTLPDGAVHHGPTVYFPVAGARPAAVRGRRVAAPGPRPEQYDRREEQGVPSQSNLRVITALVKIFPGPD
jgi:hypothetical protein